MLIATLPTLTSPESRRLSEEILKHPLIESARYNTGGDSPYTPKQILEILKPIADRYGKVLYIDLEGRQMRVAHWSPFSRGAVTLNRDFVIELPGQIHFRRAGWCDIINALPEERKIFFRPHRTKEEYYLGESQSVNIIARNLEVKGYLENLDFAYIKAAIELGMRHFMLSFIESPQDMSEFRRAYRACGMDCSLPAPQLVLKIESQKGMDFVKSLPKNMPKNLQLMAARDDLFLSFIKKRFEFLDALRIIVRKDKKAILASKIMSGLLTGPQELTIGDMSDISLMSQFGYKNFMLSDELADLFELAIQDWQEIIVPLLEGKK